MKPFPHGFLDAFGQPMDRCARCARALDRVYFILAGSNHCPWCLHPILLHHAFAASRALVLMDSRHKLIRDLIAAEDARARGKEPT